VRKGGLKGSIAMRERDLEKVKRGGKSSWKKGVIDGKEGGGAEETEWEGKKLR